MFASARFVRRVVRPLHCPWVHRGLAYNFKNFTYTLCGVFCTQSRLTCLTDTKNQYMLDIYIPTSGYRNNLARKKIKLSFLDSLVPVRKIRQRCRCKIYDKKQDLGREEIC